MLVTVFSDLGAWEQRHPQLDICSFLLPRAQLTCPDLDYCFIISKQRVNAGMSRRSLLLLFGRLMCR